MNSLVNNAETYLEEYILQLSHFNSPLQVAGVILISISLLSTALGLFIKYKYRDYGRKGRKNTKLKLRKAREKFWRKKEKKNSRYQHDDSFSDYDRYSNRNRELWKVKTDRKVKNKKSEKFKKKKESFFSKSKEKLTSDEFNESNQNVRKRKIKLKNNFVEDDEEEEGEEEEEFENENESYNENDADVNNDQTVDEELDDTSDYDDKYEEYLRKKIKKDKLKKLNEKKKIRKANLTNSLVRCNCCLKLIAQSESRPKNKYLTDSEEIYKENDYDHDLYKEKKETELRNYKQFNELDSGSEKESWNDDTRTWDLNTLDTTKPKKNQSLIEKKRHSWSSHFHISSPFKSFKPSFNN